MSLFDRIAQTPGAERRVRRRIRAVVGQLGRPAARTETLSG